MYTEWQFWTAAASCWLGFGMLRQLAWAAGGYRSSPLAARKVGNKSTGGCYHPELSPNNENAPRSRCVDIISSSPSVSAFTGRLVFNQSRKSLFVRSSQRGLGSSNLYDSWIELLHKEASRGQSRKGNCFSWCLLNPVVFRHLMLNHF